MVTLNTVNQIIKPSDLLVHITLIMSPLRQYYDGKLI